MKFICFALVGGLLCCVSLAAQAAEQQVSPKDVNEEMQLINKSLEGLLSELAVIKREATGRLSQVRRAGLSSNGLSQDKNENERIRQTKVSRFVLKRVAELESESLGVRDEMAKLFELQKKTISARSSAQTKQEDLDFDEPPSQQASPAATTTTTTTTTTTSTMKPADQEQEAAQIGFDLEQLKRLGEEIGKRLDQFGKDAAKNLGELMEGIKLVFREPSKTTTAKPARASPGNELESEIEARQAQNPESIRGVHEQIIKLTDQMVQNYLGSMRRVIHRFNNLLGDNRRSGLTPNSSVHGAGHSPSRQSSPTGSEQPKLAEPEQVVGKLEGITKKFAQFSEEFPKALDRQSSPLIDRIPPRGVELWRDFWDTVRKQFRRINQEFVQVSRDMGRLLTGRRPSTGSERVVVVRPREGEQADKQPALAHLLYSGDASLSNRQAIEQEFQEFYDKLSAQLRMEQQKMDELRKASGSEHQQQHLRKGQEVSQVQDDKNAYELIDSLDDEQTRQVLAQNPGLRQQINQDINVFSSIFDIIRTFLSRLRGSAEDIRNILERPGAMRDNNSVTPGPAVKPTVDQLLKDTVDSQRNINSQAKPSGRR